MMCAIVHSLLKGVSETFVEIAMFKFMRAVNVEQHCVLFSYGPVDYRKMLSFFNPSSTEELTFTSPYKLGF